VDADGNSLSSSILQRLSRWARPTGSESVLLNGRVVPAGCRILSHRRFDQVDGRSYGVADAAERAGRVLAVNNLDIESLPGCSAAVRSLFHLEAYKAQPLPPVPTPSTRTQSQRTTT
jgi:hypothetical protein